MNCDFQKNSMNSNGAQLHLEVAAYSFLTAREMIRDIARRATARVLKTVHESRARDHAVKCQETWHPHFQNLFNIKV